MDYYQNNQWYSLKCLESLLEATCLVICTRLIGYFGYNIVHKIDILSRRCSKHEINDD